MQSGKLGFFDANFDNMEVYSGSILISEPLLVDLNFNRSVILVTEHNEKGTFGLVLNKEIDKYLSDVIYGFEDVKIPLYRGGPVALDTLHYIHRLGDRVHDSIKIGENLYWGGDIEDLRRLATLGVLKEQDVRFFIGYSGWEPMQLERELEKKAWAVSSISSRNLFSTNADTLWEDCVRTMGGKFNIWLNYPVDPILN